MRVICGAVLLAFAGLCSAEERPVNILFIMADDLGVRDQECYGSDYYRTPSLDGLAAQGARFTRAYAACGVCSPTRASILTGRYPHRVRLTDALPFDRLFDNPKMVPPDHLKELPSELPTFAKALRKAGYRTALFGKWHLGSEYQFFTKGGHAAYGFDEAFDTSGREKVRDKGVAELTDRTLDFLEANQKQPFMLCLMHHTPHVPLVCPPEDESLYDDVPKGRLQKNQRYAGMISHLDQAVKTVLEKLTVLGLEENTVVIFTSDNGGLNSATSNEPYRGGKGSLYEGGIRVPLIVRWPGRIAAGTVCDAPVHSADYFPTFLELAGLKARPEAHRDGMTMLPVWSGSGVEHRSLYWHFPHRHDPSSAVMEDHWKLVHGIVTGQYELFDLKADPEEANDHAADHPERVEHLARLLEEHLQATGSQRMRPNPQWDAARPKGKQKSYGIAYPAGGGTYQPVKEPRPRWFKQADGE